MLLSVIDPDEISNMFFFFLKIFLFIHERHRERQRLRQREKQAPWEPDLRLNLRAPV